MVVAVVRSSVVMCIVLRVVVGSGVSAGICVVGNMDVVDLLFLLAVTFRIG